MPMPSPWSGAWASRNPARLLFQATYAQPLSGRETEENLTLLQGNDIVLRAVEREDLPNYVEWLNDRTVLEYFGQYLSMTLAQEEKWYEAMLPDPDTCTFSIEYEGQHVGGAGFTQIEARQRNAKVGLFIGVPDLWDPGLGSDVMQTILRYGFRHLNCIVSTCGSFSRVAAPCTYKRSWVFSTRAGGARPSSEMGDTMTFSG